MDAVEYSIGVNNRFGLLADDEEPSDVVQDSDKSAKDKKDKKAKNVRPVKDTKLQPTKKEKEAANEETRKDARDNKKGGRVPKDGVRRENEKNTKISNGPREDRENIPPRGGKGGFNRRKENEGAPEGDSPAKDDKREAGSGMGFGGRGRGGRGGNVARGGRGGFDRGARGGRKRDYDRRSGSDRTETEESTGLPSRRSVKPQDKRDGGGSFNWGNPADAQEGEVFDEKKTEWEESSPDTEETKAPAEDGPVEDAADAEEPSEEAKQMTLEEWKELQEQFRSKITFEVRKPGEGEKKGQWKNTHLLQKKSDEEERQQLYEERIKTSGRVRQTVPGIQFSFTNTETQENRRGGRGGGRGGRGRGGGRGSGRGRGGRGGFGGSRDGGAGAGNADFEINQEEFPTLG